MDAAELRARLRNPDPEERSLAIQEIALAGRFDRGLIHTLIHTLIEGLEDDDPVTKEWSTVALRRFRGNPEAIQALWARRSRDDDLLPRYSPNGVTFGSSSRVRTSATRPWRGKRRRRRRIGVRSAVIRCPVRVRALRSGTSCGALVGGRRRRQEESRRPLSQLPRQAPRWRGEDRAEAGPTLCLDLGQGRSPTATARRRSVYRAGTSRAHGRFSDCPTHRRAASQDAPEGWGPVGSLETRIPTGALRAKV